MPVVVGREVRLLVNARASGAGGAHEVVARATAALRAAGARVDALLTADEGELAAAVREAGDRRVVLVGGDGTVHAFANLGLPALPPAALLPAGRANNIARALGIPVDWDAAAELAVRGRPAAVDALEVVAPERRLFALEGVSAEGDASARHRYTDETPPTSRQGVRALVTELAAFRAPHVVLHEEPAEAGLAFTVPNVPAGHLVRVRAQVAGRLISERDPTGRTPCRPEQLDLLQPLGRPPDHRVGDPGARGDVNDARVAVALVEHPQQRPLVVGRGHRAARRNSPRRPSCGSPKGLRFTSVARSPARR